MINASINSTNADKSGSPTPGDIKIQQKKRPARLSMLGYTLLYVDNLITSQLDA